MASTRHETVRDVSKKPAGKEKFMNTSHGKVRVLEYGFDSPDVTPLFINLHGGGFVLGGAYMNDEMNLYFMEKSKIKIIDIDYPKAPKNPFPAAVDAIHEIIRHYVGNAAKYKIDPNRVGIGGHSAGANLATVMCIKAHEKGDMTFKFQIMDYPPLDMAIDPFKRFTPEGAVSPKMDVMFYWCYFNNDMEAAKSPYISPVYATSKQLAGLPPTLIIVAGRDSLHDDGVRYRQMLEGAGIAVEFHDFKDSVHGFTYNKTPDAKEGHRLMGDYISRHI